MERSDTREKVYTLKNEKNACAAKMTKNKMVIWSRSNFGTPSFSKPCNCPDIGLADAKDEIPEAFDFGPKIEPTICPINSGTLMVVI